MKRILKAAAALAVLVLGTSLAFADEAQYDKLLAEGKAYEEKGQWVHAMGAYWDAIGTNLGDAKEAQERFDRIYNIFGEYGYVGHDIPNPGPGEYDDFSRYDGWIELCKDFEIYWNEHPGEIFTTNLECTKGDLDMKSRTASYNFTLVAVYSEKFLRMGTKICYVFRQAYKKYGSDWPDIPKQWPAVSIFKDSKTIPVVKFISAPCEFHTTSNKESYLDLDPYTIAKSYCEGLVYGNSLSFNDGKTTEAYVAAWNNFIAIEPSDKLGLWEDDVSVPYKNMSIKVSIKDENGRTIASMGKPAPFGTFPHVGGKNDYRRGKFSSAFTISGISASDIKVLDSGKWTYSIDSFVLTPREATAKAENSGGGFNQGTKLTNVKYKTVSPTIDYLKGNAGFANIDVIADSQIAYKIKEAISNGKITKSNDDSLWLNESEEYIFVLPFERSNDKWYFYSNQQNSGVDDKYALSILNSLGCGTFSIGEFSRTREDWKFSIGKRFYRPATEAEKKALAEKQAAEAKAKADAEAKKISDMLAKISPEPKDYASILVDSESPYYLDYKIGNYEVTQYLFEKLVGYNPSTIKNPLLPVNNINFYEIMVFCNRLSIAAGLTPVYIINKSANPDDWGAIPTEKDKKWEKYKKNKKADGYSICKHDDGSSECYKITKLDDFGLAGLYDYWDRHDYNFLFKKMANCSFRVAKKK
ncbi:hypothetical protein [Treponema zioleckii]|uniref:hypothetical protein n=1 Tax=Treponema zioleckii TaxID=331680 RepID=UPI00168A4650|nr:hypothetical protein [Treponema zioleckii]